MVYEDRDGVSVDIWFINMNIIDSHLNNIP